MGSTRILAQCSRQGRPTPVWVVKTAAACHKIGQPDSRLMLQSTVSSIESKKSWAVAMAALFTMLMAFGAAWITAVALKDIAAEVNGIRSIPALASALAWLGSGVGGILMGRLADKVGTRWTVICGALMIGLGLAISTLGPPWPLWVGHGLFIGLIGLGGINAPMYIYVSRWFDRRRGSALALISSGSYLAGAMWPPLFERVIADFGWRQTMLWYGALEIVVIIPLAITYFSAPPEVIHPAAPTDGAGAKVRVLGWPPNVVFAVMCVAAVLCCIPMAMPQGHLVAFCSDLGIARSTGALMLSVLLGTAFLSRQIWGAISDRIGGLATVFIGSGWQAASMTALLLTQNEAGSSRSPPRSGSVSPELFRLMCSPCANCFPPRRHRGAYRHCCYSAAAAWRSAAGSRGCSTITSAITHPLSQPGSAPTFSICFWSARSSAVSGCAFPMRSSAP